MGELCFDFILTILYLSDLLIFMFVCSAKPRPSKKARLNKPADNNVAIEPEKTPDPVETNTDALLDDSPPQDYDFMLNK